jgi:hypothetical protein
MNPVFKQRLKETGIGLLCFLAAGVFVGVVALLVFWLSHLHLSPFIREVIEWALLVALGGLLLTLLVKIIIAIASFIYWLFIEPFCKNKQTKE